MLVPSSDMKRFLEARCQAYEKQLRDNQEASAYVAKRGLTSEVVAEHRLGFVEVPAKGDDHYRGRLVLPYQCVSAVTSLKFRAIDNSPDRFRKDANDPNRIYNAKVLQRAREVWITEGEIDCLSLCQLGLPAVGIPGAKNWKPEWSRVFRNREVVVVADGDDAGREFVDMVRSKIYSSKGVYMPQGEDANSMLVNRGPEWLREKVGAE